MVQPNEQHDSDLLRLLSRDDEGAMEALFKKYYAFVSIAVLRLIADPETAEDIAQEVFMEIWKRRNALDIQISLKAYLRKTAVNKTLNYIRHQKNYKSEELSEQQFELHASENTSLETNELQALIEQAVEQLPERCRLVFKLSRLEEMSYQEIADKLDISVKTVENQIVKALKQLRETLRPFLNGGLLSLVWWLGIGFLGA